MNNTLSVDSEAEANSAPMRPVLVPTINQSPANAPLQLEVNLSDDVAAPTCVPLCVVTNPRSAWNKIRNVRTFLRQTVPDILILSEHWGRKKPFQEALSMEHFKVIESSRGTRGVPTRGRNGRQTMSVTGGGVALVYNESNFNVEKANVDVPEGLEIVWAILNFILFSEIL